MAFPTVAATNTSTGGPGTTHTISLPAGIVSGDLLIIFFTTAQYWGKLGTLTDPSGWTRLGTAGDGGGFDDAGLTVFYKVATGSEGSTVDVGTTSSVRSAHISLRITGPCGTPQISTFDTGSGDPNPPSLTPSGGARDYLWIAAGSVKGTSQSVSAYPTNYTGNNLFKDNPGGEGTNAMVATRQLNATSEDPGTFDVTNDRKVACTVAVYLNIINVTVTPSTKSIAFSLPTIAVLIVAPVVAQVLTFAQNAIAVTGTALVSASTQVAQFVQNAATPAIGVEVATKVLQFIQNTILVTGTANADAATQTAELVAIEASAQVWEIIQAAVQVAAFSAPAISISTGSLVPAGPTIMEIEQVALRAVLGTEYERKYSVQEDDYNIKYT